MDKLPSPNFKDIFEKSERNIVSLYSKNDSVIPVSSFPISNRMRSTQDVIMSVDENVRLLQKADVVVNDNMKRKRVMQRNQSGIVPFSTLLSSPTNEKHYPITKFDTQLGVTDTQLIAVTDGAEAMMDIMQNKHGTQYFETTNKSFSINKLLIDRDNPKPSTSFASNNYVNKGEHMNVAVLSHNEDIEYGNKANNTDKQGHNIVEESESGKEGNLQLTQVTCISGSNSNINNKIPISPILKVSNKSYKKVRRKDTSLSSTTFDLEDFEKFEQRLQDSEQVNIVNSQILGEELHFIIGKTTDVKFSKIPSQKDSVSQYYEKDNDLEMPSRISQVMPTVSDVLILSGPCKSNENEMYDDGLNTLNVNTKLDTCKNVPAPIKSNNSDEIKELYVAFYTASNKSIKVSSTSLNKSLSAFEEIDKEDPCIPSSKFQCNLLSNDLEEVFEGTWETNSKMHFEATDEFRKPSTTPNLNDQQFKTTEAVTENLFSRTPPKVFIDGDANYFSDTQELLLNEKRVDNLLKSRNVFAEKTNIFPSFTTASNKEIHVSEKALKKSGAMFNDIDLEVKYISNQNVGDFPTTSNQLTEVLGKINENTNKILPSVPPNKKSTLGFTTASNKVINVSEKTLEKTKNLFDDLDCDEFSKWEESLNDVATTGNNTALVSKKSSAKNKNISNCRNGAERNFNALEKVPRISTASNTMIPVSENVLQETKNLFDGVDEEVSFGRSIKQIEKVPKKNLENIDSICNKAFDDVIIENNNVTDPKLPFKGFATASNKPVTVSEKALSKTKHIFDNLDDFGTNVKDFISDNNNSVDLKVPFKGFATASNKPVTVSEKALLKTKHIFDNLDDFGTNLKDFVSDNNNSVDPKVSFNGFTTASNKPVTVSEKALSKTKHIFDNLDDFGTNVKDFISDNNNSVDLKVPFKGFATVSNKPVTVSEKALSKTKHIFDNLDDFGTNVKDFISDNNNSVDQKVPFKGFVTASNKPVTVSEKALSKTKHIFDNLDDFGTNVKDYVQDFLTTNNKIKSTPEKTLEDTKNLFNDFGQGTSNVIANHKIPLKGFATASNRPVLVSEKAILKTKNIFDDLDIIKDSIKEKERIPLQRFSTASNETMFASKKTLEAKTKKFNDLDQENIEEIADQEILIKHSAVDNNKLTPVLEETNVNNKRSFDDIEKINNDTNKKGKMTFQGFLTASNKNIHVSEQALEKTKNVFCNLDRDKTNIVANREIESHDLDQDDINEISNQEKSLKRFPTIENKSVNTLELMETKMPYTTTSNQDKIIPKPVISRNDIGPKRLSENSILKSNNPNVGELKAYQNEELDTQVIEHFENKHFTGDTQKFAEIPSFEENTNNITIGTPSSPIFSCPSARKTKSKKSFNVPYRKFRKILSETPAELPFNTDIEKTLEKKIECELKIAISEYDCRDGNRKLRISLKELKHLDGNENCNFVNENEMLSFEDLSNFTFKNERIDIPKYCSNKISVPDLEAIFLSSVDRNLVPDGWFLNHFKLIAWKLISYESFFPNTMKNVFSVKHMLEQLKYRFQKELYRVERPCLRKVLEMDEVSSRNMVLFVAKIHDVKDESGSEGIELDLSDGWYIVRTSSLDKLMVEAVRGGKIRIGTKLLIYGAELLNCDQGKSPLEDISNVRLRICGNSTRRVMWDTKLGFFRRQKPILVPLRSVSIGGGKVSKLRVFIARIYPRIYVEKLPDGSTVTRSERLETVFATKFESDQQFRLEKVYEDVEKELGLTQSSQSDSGTCLLKMGTKRALEMESGSQIYKMMRLADDVEEFQKNLTNTQNELVRVYDDRRRVKLQEKIENHIRSKLADQGFNQVLRKVVPLLKMRVVTWDDSSNPESDMRTAFISIWRPDEGLNDVLKEGQWIDILNAIPTSVRLSEVQLSANNKTIFVESKIANICQHSDELEKAISRKHTPLANAKVANRKMFFNEIDTCGLVFHIEPPMMTAKDNYQMVFLTDGEFNMASIIFWNGIQKFGFENIVEVGQFVGANNLQKRMGGDRKGIPQFRVTEFSTFTRIPKLEHQVEGMQKLKCSFNECDLLNLNNFCKNCLEAKIYLEASVQLANTKNSTPCNNKKSVISKNSTSIQKNNRYNFDVYTADFESTFVSESNESYSKNKSKLKSYGEPPPLTEIKLINKCNNVLKQFESPIRNNILKENFDSCQSVEVNENKNVAINENSLSINESNLNISKNDINGELDTSIPNVAVTKKFKDLGVASSEKLVVKERSQCFNFVGTSLEVRKLFMNPIKIDFDQDENVSNEDVKALSVKSGFEEDFEFSPPMSLE